MAIEIPPDHEKVESKLSILKGVALPWKIDVHLEKPVFTQKTIHPAKGVDVEALGPIDFRTLKDKRKNFRIAASCENCAFLKTAETSYRQYGFCTYPHRVKTVGFENIVGMRPQKVDKRSPDGKRVKYSPEQRKHTIEDAFNAGFLPVHKSNVCDKHKKRITGVTQEMMERWTLHKFNYETDMKSDGLAGDRIIPETLSYADARIFNE